jgi:hypothetical protein
MYPTILTLHSWLRWLVIGAGLWAVASAASRRAGDRDRAGLVFTVSLDLQLVLGVILFVALSPITQAALADMAGAMKNRAWRFWTVEHPALMILALVFAHVGRIVGRRGGAGRGRLLWYTLALLALLATIPWPFLAHGRPLFRW